MTRGFRCGVQCTIDQIFSVQSASGVWWEAMVFVGGEGGGGGVRAMMKVSWFLISKCWQVCLCAQIKISTEYCVTKNPLSLLPIATYLELGLFSFEWTDHRVHVLLGIIRSWSSIVFYLIRNSRKVGRPTTVSSVSAVRLSMCQMSRTLRHGKTGEPSNNLFNPFNPASLSILIFFLLYQYQVI